MITERSLQMVKRLELLNHLMDFCNAENVRIVNEAGLNLTVEIVINRKSMETCYQEMVNKGWENNVIGIEKINKGDRGYVETGDGLYRYTLQFVKTF